MKIKKLTAVGAALGIVLAGVVTTAPAHADPVSNSYVLTGSDTLEAVLNALVNGSDVTGSLVQVKSNGATLASYDAFGSSTVQTKPNGPFFPRPSGSGNGVTSLISSINNTTFLGSLDTIGGQVDIARSSSSGTSNAAGDLTYVPFGKDALGYIYNATGYSAAQIDIIDSLTAAQLKQIYDAGPDATAGERTITVGGVSVVLTPRLPQSTSGTRTTFLTKIAATITASDYTSEGSTSAGTPENDAAVIAGAPAAGQIIPFSVASWIAQANGGAAKDTTTTAGVFFGHADNTIPYDGVAPALTPNAAYYASNWGRDTYLVIEYARTQQFLPTSAGFPANTPNPRYDARLAALVNPTGPAQTSLVSNGASNNAPGKVKNLYGFLAPSNTTPFRVNATVYTDSVWPGTP